MNVLWVTDAPPPHRDFETNPVLSFVRCTYAGALDVLRRNTVDAALLDSAEQHTDILLHQFSQERPDLPILIRGRALNRSEAARFTRLGAFHWIDETATPSEIRTLIATARDLALQRGRYPSPEWRKLLVGDSAPIRNLANTISLIGPRKCTVLIAGETGTGKELVARALHLASSRANLPMVAVNCTALPENLLEAELFGHVRGAFTGAIAPRAGRFEQANRSTIFLDEIADMPLEVQGKLLRVLQEREFQRLGSSETLRTDVRVIAACNANLRERVDAARFREDLYYRLNVIPIETPPLRDRVEDIPALVEHFVSKVAQNENIRRKIVSREGLAQLMSYTWPGNVRQLENAVEMAMILSGDRDTLGPLDFRFPATPSAPARSSLPSISLPDRGLDFTRTVGAIERDLLEQALTRTQGNKKQAAEILGLKRTTLAAKLKSLESLAV